MSRLVHGQPPIDRLGPATLSRWEVPRVTSVCKAIIALGIGAVVITGCSSPERSEPVTLPTPPALSSAAYQEKLQSASSAVAPAFDRFAAVESPQDAHAELERASAAVLDTARLLDVTPPSEVVAVHRDMLAGLRQLATDLSQLSDQAASMELCAGPSIVPSVSNTPGMNNLRTVQEALSSGRLGASYQWGEFLPAPTLLPERRLANGQLIDSLRRTGSGQLEVDNGTEHDAVVKLVQGDKPIVSVYVRNGSTTTVEKINDGSYELFYTSGTDWDEQLKTFTRSCQFKRMEEPAEFTTTQTSGGTSYTIQTVGLQPRIGGNASAAEVPDQSFPK